MQFAKPEVCLAQSVRGEVHGVYVLHLHLNVSNISTYISAKIKIKRRARGFLCADDHFSCLCTAGSSCILHVSKGDESNVGNYRCEYA